MTPRLPAHIVRIAEAQIGLSEIGKSNKGPEIQKFFDADNYDPNGPQPGDDGYAWCAAFVCWVVREAMESAGIPETATYKRPRNPGAWAFEKWSLAQDATTQTKKPAGMDIQAGDLVIFAFSHIGIAVSGPRSDRTIITVEGNTNAAGAREGGSVQRKTRHVSQIRSRIRFTV